MVAERAGARAQAPRPAWPRTSCARRACTSTRRRPRSAGASTAQKLTHSCAAWSARWRGRWRLLRATTASRSTWVRVPEPRGRLRGRGPDLLPMREASTCALSSAREVAVCFARWVPVWEWRAPERVSRVAFLGFRPMGVICLMGVRGRRAQAAQQLRAGGQLGRDALRRRERRGRRRLQQRRPVQWRSRRAPGGACKYPA
jgi:hypothetical protein